MKVYRISKWTFGGICVLILLLPVSRHWKVLTMGERTTGTVTQMVRRVMENRAGDRYPVQASEIEFLVNDSLYLTYGPSNYEYKKGRRLTILYMRKDPSKNCIFTFTGFYLNNYVVLPLILLTVWYAFYLSFNNYYKRLKIPNKRSARPPAFPTRRIPK
jgi:hypothetical protein